MPTIRSASFDYLSNCMKHNIQHITITFSKCFLAKDQTLSKTNQKYHYVQKSIIALHRKATGKDKIYLLL